MKTYVSTPASARAGFSLVEVLVALVILTVGVLGLAGTTVLVVRQVTMADLATERAAALQSVVEQLRATPYDDLAAGSETVGLFSVSWTPAALSTSTMVRVVTTGPGLETGTGSMPYLAGSVVDTFNYRIIEP